jgi:TolA-binding protein
MPAPGEMVSESPTNSYQTGVPAPVAASPRLIATRTPHHNRAPSLGELHQELENEQEFQVNRLLTQIRQLQEQVQRQQQQNPSGVAGDEGSERSVSGPAPVPVPAPVPNMTSSPQPTFPSSGSLPRSPVFPRSSFDMARADLRHRSRTPSRNASPRLRSTSITADSGEPWALAGRDESAFYQAESQMLVRENQMLRHRIREMERQLAELQGTNTSSLTHEPSHSSHLNHSVSASEEDAAKLASAAAAAQEHGAKKE